MTIDQLIAAVASSRAAYDKALADKVAAIDAEAAAGVALGEATATLQDAIDAQVAALNAH